MPSQSSHAAPPQPRYYGKYRGRVTDNADPQNRGRIKARVPEVLLDVETGWALPCAPYSGNGSGTFTLPPAEAGVWIEFEAGDVSRPIWSGCWWGDGQLPADEQGTQAVPGMKLMRSEQGLLVCLNDDANTISVSDSGGGNKVLIEVQSGQITIKSDSKVVVDTAAIELIAGASHPVVFGDLLLSYLNDQVKMLYDQHLHATDLCLGFLPVVPSPPVVPMPPATQMLHSNKVKSG